MNPGRELDALIAEKVMGLELAGELYGDGDFVYLSPSEPWSTLIAWSPVPHYSTSIADAWQLVEKMSVMDPWSGWHFELYRCAHGHEAKFSSTYEVNGHECDFTGVSLSAPHAICLAALKAVGVKI